MTSNETKRNEIMTNSLMSTFVMIKVVIQQNDEYVRIMKIVIAETRNMLNDSKNIVVSNTVYCYTTLFIYDIFTSRQIFKIKVVHMYIRD